MWRSELGSRSLTIWLNIKDVSFLFDVQSRAKNEASPFICFWNIAKTVKFQYVHIEIEDQGQW